MFWPKSFYNTPDLLQDDPSRKLMRQIFGAIAEYEKTMIVLKLRGARQRARARDGRCEGAKPFGALPGEAEVLQRIKAMQAAGETGYTIANRLNAEGIASRRVLYPNQWFRHQNTCQG